jgi:hypothetical protein
VNWVIEAIRRISAMEGPANSKKAYTPLIILSERMVLGYADNGDVGRFVTLGELSPERKNGYLWFMTTLLRDKQEDVHKSLRQYCPITAENISVYAHGRTPLNVFSILHLTVESLMIDYVFSPFVLC